jgi:hypothetical protein
MAKVFSVILNLAPKSKLIVYASKATLHFIRRKPVLNHDSRGQNLKKNNFSEDKTIAKDMDLEEK